MCSLLFSRTLGFTMTLSLVVHSGIASGENMELWEAPETIPTSSELRGALPLQKASVKQPGSFSGIFPRDPDLSRVADNISFVTRSQQKQNQRDNKLLAVSSPSAFPDDVELASISANVTQLRRGGLYFTTGKNEQEFPHESLPQHDKKRQKISGNKTNNHNLPHANINYFQQMKGQRIMIQNSTSRNGTIEKKIPFFDYINVSRSGNNFRWKVKPDENKVSKEKGSNEIDKTDKMKAKRHSEVISSQRQTYAMSPKTSFFRSGHGYKSPKIFGRLLHIKRKRSPSVSKVHLGKVHGPSRIRRGFHFVYENQEVYKTPKMASDTADKKISPELMPLITAKTPFFFNPSFDSTFLEKLAQLIQTPSERLTGFSSRRRILGQNQFKIPLSETLDLPNSPSPLPRLYSDPSGLLSLVRSQPNFVRNPEANHQLYTEVDDRVFRLTNKHLATRDFNFPSTDHLPEKYPVQIIKKNFDAIGEGILSGMKQNHIGKRYGGLFSTGTNLRRYTDTYPENINFKPDTASITLDLLENDIDNLQHLYRKRGGNDDYLYEGGAGAVLNSYYDTKKRNMRANRNYDSERKWTIKAITQYFKDKNKREYVNSFSTGDADVNYLEKRLDAISNGALGGIRQNFLDKKHSQSYSKESLPVLFKDLLSNTHSQGPGIDIKDGYSSKTVSKMNSNKFTTPRIRWRLNMNFDNDRKMPSRHLSTESKSKSSFPKKRNNDLIFPTYSNEISHSYLEPDQIRHNSIVDSVPISFMNNSGERFNQQGKLYLKTDLSRLSGLYFVS